MAQAKLVNIGERARKVRLFIGIGAVAVAVIIGVLFAL
jgi:type III secretory pathway component EscS